MAFSARESNDNCLTRTDGAFEDLVVYDKRELFYNKNIAKTEMALMLYQDTLPLRIVSDILTWPARNKKAMTNRFAVSLGEGLPDGDYQILAVSRETGNDKWEKDYYAYANCLNIQIAGARMSISSNLKPVVVDDILMSVMGEHKLIATPTGPGDARIKLFSKLTNYNSDIHELETAVEIYSDTDLLIQTVGQQTFTNNGQQQESDIFFEQRLDDGQYWMRSVYRERGSSEWMEMLNAEEHVLPFTVHDGFITLPEEEEIQLSALAFQLDDQPYETFFTTAYPRDSITHCFENIRLTTTLSFPDDSDRCFDHAWVLSEDASGLAYGIVAARYCSYVAGQQDSVATVFTISDTLSIDGSLPDGHYLLRDIARDASRQEWLPTTPNRYGSCLHLFIEGDTLKLVPDYEYNLRHVSIGQIVFRNHPQNKYNYWLHLQDLPEYDAYGPVHLRYHNENDEPEDIVYMLATPSADSLEICIDHPINSEYTVSVISEQTHELGRNVVVPRHENLSLEGVGVFSTNGLTDVSLTNTVVFLIKKEKEIDDESIYFQFKCLDDTTITGDVILKSYQKGGYNMPHYTIPEDTKYLYNCPNATFTDENSFRDWIGKRSCVEVGYMSNWNEYTPIGCSEEYTPEGFITGYALDEEKSWENGRARFSSFYMTISDPVVVPDEALAINLTDVYANRVTIVPNQNPNCLYNLNENDSIPVSLRCHPIWVDTYRVDSLTIVDGFPFFENNSLRYKRLSYQRTFEADKWTTVAIPFPMKEDSWGTDDAPELYQLAYRNGSFVMEPFTYNFYLWTFGKMAVVKGNGKCVNILERNDDNPDYKCATSSFYSWNMDCFSVFSACFSRHLDAYYELSDDGQELVLKSGETQPYRTYLIPNTSYRPERIRVWLPGETPTSIEDINDGKRLFVVNRYALDGRKVDADYKGVTILQYNDGTTRKVMSPSINP